MTHLFTPCLLFFHLFFILFFYLCGCSQEGKQWFQAPAGASAKACKGVAKSPVVVRRLLLYQYNSTNEGKGGEGGASPTTWRSLVGY